MSIRSCFVFSDITAVENCGITGSWIIEIRRTSLSHLGPSLTTAQSRASDDQVAFFVVVCSCMCVFLCTCLISTYILLHIFNNCVSET